jgi:hypothetical protein
MSSQKIVEESVTFLQSTDPGTPDDPKLWYTCRQKGPGIKNIFKTGCFTSKNEFAKHFGIENINSIEITVENLNNRTLWTYTFGDDDFFIFPDTKVYCLDHGIPNRGRYRFDLNGWISFFGQPE